DVVARHRARVQIAEGDLARARVVGESSGPDDRVVEPALGHVFVRLRLGLQIRLHLLGPALVMVGADRADDQIPPYALSFRRIGELDRAAVVDRPLSRGAGAGTG